MPTIRHPAPSPTLRVVKLTGSAGLTKLLEREVALGRWPASLSPHGPSVGPLRQAGDRRA